MSALKPSFSSCLAVGFFGEAFLLSSSSICLSMKATISAFSAPFALSITTLRISANISRFVILDTSFFFLCFVFFTMYIILYFFYFVNSFFYFFYFVFVDLAPYTTWLIAFLLAPYIHLHGAFCLTPIHLMSFPYLTSVFIISQFFEFVNSFFILFFRRVSHKIGSSPDFIYFQPESMS